MPTGVRKSRMRMPAFQLAERAARNLMKVCFQSNLPVPERSREGPERRILSVPARSGGGRLPERDTCLSVLATGTGQSASGASGTAPRDASGRFRSEIRQKQVVGGIPSLDVLDADRGQAGFVGVKPAMGRHRIGGEHAFDGQTEDLLQPLEIVRKSTGQPDPRDVVAAGAR